MKNRRDICSTKDAGWISYPGLPGPILTGCMASPAFKSRFCQEHQVWTCESNKSEEETGMYKVLQQFAVTLQCQTEKCKSVKCYLYNTTIVEVAQ